MVNSLVRVGMVLAASLAIGVMNDALDQPASSATPIAPLVLTIPQGSFAAGLAGAPDAGLPKDIKVRVGQSIIVKNDDVALHYLASLPVMPGESATLVFSKPGKFAYSGGLSCSLSVDQATIIEVLPR